MSQRLSIPPSRKSQKPKSVSILPQQEEMPLSRSEIRALGMLFCSISFLFGLIVGYLLR